VSIVAVADRLAGGLPNNFRLDLPSLEIPTDLLDDLKLTREQVEAVRNKLPEQLDTVSAMLA
jgi:hypothetical protein